jgi:hypothetical protein
VLRLPGANAEHHIRFCLSCPVPSETTAEEATMTVHNICYAAVKRCKQFITGHSLPVMHHSDAQDKTAEYYEILDPDRKNGINEKATG